MPELSAPRPVLRSFRVLAFSGQNQGEATGATMQIKLQQDIEVGLLVANVTGAPLMASVRIELQVTATNDRDAGDTATFSGEYEAKFSYAKEVSEDAVTPLMDDSDYQYLLVAQAFPLAMTHTRRELQSMGLDTRQFLLGLE